VCSEREKLLLTAHLTIKKGNKRAAAVAKATGGRGACVCLQVSRKKVNKECTHTLDEREVRGGGVVNFAEFFISFINTNRDTRYFF